MSITRWSRALGLLTALVSLEACSGDTTSPADVDARRQRSRVASVTLTPQAATIAAGGSIQLATTVRNAYGDVLSGRTVTWSVAGDAYAVVSGTGMVQGRAAGIAYVMAWVEGKADTTVITVTASNVAPPPPAPLPAPVASVTISPQTASVNVGATVQLVATLRDAEGNVLTGRAISWSSSSGAIAMVAGTGLVTGVLGGVTTVTATSEGRTAAAIVTVTTPLAPPTSFREPAGYSAIVDRLFNSKATDGADRGTGSFPLRSGGSEGWDGAEWSYANISIAQDSTAPNGGAQSVMRFAYPAHTVPAGTTYAPGTAQTQGFSSAVHGYLRYRKLYVRFWFKLGTGFQNHPAGMKLMFFRSNEPNGLKFEPIIGIHGQPGAAGLHFNLQGTQDNGRGDLMPNAGTGTDVNNLKLNTWYLVEVQLEMNSAYGVANGILRGWLNGVQVFNYGDIRYLRDGAAYVWNNVHVVPTWGGQGGTIQQSWSWYLDQLYASGAP